MGLNRHALRAEMMVVLCVLASLLGCSLRPKPAVDLALDNGSRVHIAFDEKKDQLWQHDRVFIAFEDGFNRSYIKILGLDKAYSIIGVDTETVSTDKSLAFAAGTWFTRCRWCLFQFSGVCFPVYVPGNIGAVYINLNGANIEVLLSNREHRYR